MVEGEIPRELGDLREVTTLDLSCNRLTGEISRELGDLQDVMALDLSRNQLSGGIPKELGGLQALDELDLSHNQLTGDLPKELSGLSDPWMFDLSDNQLSGVIPKGFFVIPADTDISPLPVRLEGNLFEGPHAEEVSRKSGLRKVVTGLPFGGGPPLPRIGHGSRRILLLPVALGYLDLATDIFTAETYYNGGHIFWFALVLFFAIAPAVIVVAFFLPHESWFSKLLVITHTSLALEALYSTVDQSYSSTLALLRVVEPLFESLPQTFLQLYAMLLVWDQIAYSPGNLLGRLLSVSFSAVCLAYAATDLCSAQALEVYVWKSKAEDSSNTCTQQRTGCGSSRMRDFLGRCYVLISRFSFRNVVLKENTETCTERLTRLASRMARGRCGRWYTSTSTFTLSRTQQIIGFFSVTITEWRQLCFTFISSFFASSRDMRGGTIELLGFGRVSKGVYFGLCFAYHIVEIGSRFLSLALAAIAIHAWTLLLLPAMFGVRCILVHCVSTKASPSDDGSHRSHSTRGPITPPHQVVDAPNRVMVPFSTIPYRMKLRLVATPFLDSVFKGERAFKVGLGLTLIEFIACLMASSLLPRRNDALPSSVRKTFAFVAIGSMVAKLVLAWWVILPIKAGVSPAVLEERSVVTDGRRASGKVQAPSGGHNLELSSDEVARTCQAAIEEGRVSTPSYGEEGISQATVEERWVAANSADDVVQLAHLRRVWPNTAGSAAVWGVHDEWPTE